MSKYYFLCVTQLYILNEWGKRIFEVIGGNLDCFFSGWKIDLEQVRKISIG